MRVRVSLLLCFSACRGCTRLLLYTAALVFQNLVLALQLFPMLALSSLSLPELVQMCSATFAHDETWHRAKVLERVDETTLLVEYLDYGDVSNVHIDHVRELK